jgi:SAM-dependent methyltransferase
MNQEELTPEKIFEKARSFMPARIILSAHELGVFEVLREKPRQSSEVAAFLSCDARGMDRLLNALVVLQLLEKKDNMFELTDVARRAFLPESEEFLAGLDHAVQMWETWSTLTDAVRRGGKVVGPPMTERDRAYFERFIKAMHANSAPRADDVIAKLPLANVTFAVDVGGGSGAYAASLARRFPHARVVLFDLPQVIEIAPDFLAKYEGGERVELVAGDMLKDELPGPADLIWLSAIVHMFSPQENEELVARCYNALAPGGKLAIQDFIMDETRTSPPAGAIFALNMLVARDAGDTYTESELRGWFEKAGFTNVCRIDTIPPNAVIMGTKE